MGVRWDLAIAIALVCGDVRQWHVPNEAGQFGGEPFEKCEESAVLLFNQSDVLSRSFVNRSFGAHFLSGHFAPNV